MPERSGPVVSNTTPLIALALLGRLDLLEALYGTVWIPPAVQAEIEAGGTRAKTDVLKSTPFIHIVPLADPSRLAQLANLDQGEAEAIVLAQEAQARLVLLDERLGRKKAKQLGLVVTGVLGILLKAKQHGHIVAVRPLVEQLQQGSFYLHPTLVAEVLNLAREE